MGGRDRYACKNGAAKMPIIQVALWNSQKLRVHEKFLLYSMSPSDFNNQIANKSGLHYYMGTWVCPFENAWMHSKCTDIPLRSKGTNFVLHEGHSFKWAMIEEK